MNKTPVVKQKMNQTIAHAILLVAVSLQGCQKLKDNAGSKSKATQSEVVHFCGDCHAYPEPETFPKFKWHEEVVQGYEFYKKSGRTDLTVPDVEAVVAYYESLAPEALKIPLADGSERSSPVIFVEESLNRVDARLPAISHISSAINISKVKPSLVVTDMREGQVSLLSFEKDGLALETIAEPPFPAHATRCDLDSDGAEDWLIADLGSFEPSDHNQGQLIWLKFDESGYLKNSTTILSKVGRVADASIADLDGDGDQDIVVAIFGWRETGKLVWLEQVKSDANQIEFEEHLLDDRHGCSHICMVDIDRDGDDDIVALFSQEHEAIDVFLNDENTHFRKTNIYKSDDPSYGSSSISLTDFDSDGDVDVLYTNGDSFDSHMIKPYHSVQILEQFQPLSFKHFSITELPGAYCVKPADIDGDGDIDLVASTMTLNFDHPFHSLIWMEQTTDKKFLRHNLETSLSQHASLALDDFDMDGDIDIAVGHFEPRPVQQANWISLWWNEGEREINKNDKVSR